MPIVPPSSRLTRANRLRRGLRARKNVKTAGGENAIAALNHGIRTPVTGIMGMLELLQASGLRPEQQALAQAAGESAEQLFSLLRGVLEVSLAEQEPAPRSSVFDLCLALQQAIDDRRHAAELRGVTLEAHFSGCEYASVQGDLQALQQILGNSIDVTIGATLPALLQVDIVIERISDDQVRLAVRLRGEGERTAAQAPAGYEFNLRQALARRLLANLQGQAGNEAGIPWFKLDLESAPSPLKNLRVLFVEADPDLRSDRLAALSSNEVRAEGFADNSAALHAAISAAGSRDPCSVLLLQEDEEMTAAGAAALPPGAMPVLVLGQQDVPGHTAQHADGWLARPCTTQTLLSTIARLAQDSGQAARPFITNVRVDPARPFAGYRILAVDDHPVILDLMSMELQALGCTVDCASGGEEALALQAANAYDAILLDCLMPAPDGYQVSARIRSRETGQRHTPIVAVTAASLREQRQKCLDAGMDDVIIKPFDRRDLQQTLRRWLRPAVADTLESVRTQFGPDFRELAELFLADAPRRLSALRQDVAARDFESAARTAHTMAGSSISIGAALLSSLCRAIEGDCRKSGGAGSATLVAAAEAEFERIEEKLRAMLAE